MELMRSALEAGADPSIQDNDGNNALHLAARKGAIDIVKMMMEKYFLMNRDKLDLRNRMQQTDWLLCVENNFADVLNTLLEAGADPCVEDIARNNPLCIAVRKKHYIILQILAAREGVIKAYGSAALDLCKEDNEALSILREAGAKPALP